MTVLSLQMFCICPLMLQKSCNLTDHLLFAIHATCSDLKPFVTAPCKIEGPFLQNRYFFALSVMTALSRVASHLKTILLTISAIEYYIQPTQCN